MPATKTQILTAVFLAAAAVHAQSASDSAAPPASTAGISPCIIGCVQPAATANGCDFTDPKCVCASAQFQADARKCLEDTCTPEEVSAAEALQAQQCGTTTPSGSATGSAPTGTGAANSTATDDTSSTPTASGTVTGTSTGTSVKPTATSPGSNSTAPSGTKGANSSAPAPSTTGAAVNVQGLGVGLLTGLVGLIGLVL